MGFQREIFAYASLMVFATTYLLSFVTGDGFGPRMGINYGTLGNNLPAPPDVVKLIKKHNFKILRIYDPHHDILDALKGSKDIDVLVGVGNQDIPNLANNPGAATSWVNLHIVPYKDSVSISYVVVGNEVIPGPYATHVAKAMANVKSALSFIGLHNIKVSTTTFFNLQTSYPPSAGVFAPDVGKMMKDVTNILKQNSPPTPLLVSLYPYYDYIYNLGKVSLEYATFRAQSPVQDGNLQYFNLLDAQIDAYRAALDKIGAGNVNIMVVETGWPTAGNEPHTSVANAQIYNTNLHNRIMSGKGTPRFPDIALEAFIFAMFDENQKLPPGSEQHWGVYFPNMTQKYNFD